MDNSSTEPPSEELPKDKSKKKSKSSDKKKKSKKKPKEKKPPPPAAAAAAASVPGATAEPNPPSNHKQQVLQEFNKPKRKAPATTPGATSATGGEQLPTYKQDVLQEFRGDSYNKNNNDEDEDEPERVESAAPPPAGMPVVQGELVHTERNDDDDEKFVQEKETARKKGDDRIFSRTGWILIIAVTVLLLVGIVVALSVALSGRGGSDDNDNNTSAASTAFPGTMECEVDPECRETDRHQNYLESERCRYLAECRAVLCYREEGCQVSQEDYEHFLQHDQDGPADPGTMRCELNPSCSDSSAHNNKLANEQCKEDAQCSVVLCYRAEDCEPTDEDIQKYVDQNKDNGESDEDDGDGDVFTDAVQPNGNGNGAGGRNGNRNPNETRRLRRQWSRLS